LRCAIGMATETLYMFETYRLYKITKI
jgi:hypothetical protein